MRNPSEEFVPSMGKISKVIKNPYNGIKGRDCPKSRLGKLRLRGHGTMKPPLLK
jgi:hypothetical protein